MGYTEDLAEAQKMRAHLERYGVKVSIELQAGAGGSWSIGTHRFIMSHHTASWPSQGPTPALRIVKLGRIDVPGPLANGYGGYDLVYRILTFGRANHPGAGGPWTAGGYTMPRDNARPYAWGSEFEGGYENYTPAMRDFMARANAGLSSYFAEKWGVPLDEYVEMNLEHKDWAPLRKPDRKGYTRLVSLAETRRVIAAARPATTPTVPTPSEEDEMPKAIEFSSRGADGKDHLYVAFPNARQYDYIESTAEKNDYANVLRRQGFDYEVWKNKAGSSLVTNPDVFGRYVGPPAARPAGAKREA